MSPLTFRPARPTDPREAAALRRLWQLFRHDLSAVDHALPDPQGRYRSERLESALSAEPGWEAWIATSAGRPVAFALARAVDQPVRVLSSFFVVAAARRDGLGTAFASTVVSAHPGPWAVAHQGSNAAAARFWPRLASRYDASWTTEQRTVPGRPDLPPDTWVRFTVRNTGGRVSGPLGADA